MTRILIAGYQHETNTFAPSPADWVAFNRGDSFPAFVRGRAMQDQLTGVNIPIGGFIDEARSRGWQLLPSAWAGAIPSAHVTEDAFERISAAICDDVRDALTHGLDAVYLDLHGAAVAAHCDDTEGELLARVRALIGPDRPLVASLDLHANVTRRMLAQADALVAYRTYPHVDMAATGALAAQLLQRRWTLGRREALRAHRLPYLIPLNAMCTQMEPAQTIYQRLVELDREHGSMLSFCMGFPAADIEECGPVLWGYGPSESVAQAATDTLHTLASPAQQWRQQLYPPAEAVVQALALAGQSSRPVIIADTQDNPGAGGDSNTTGMLHALLQQGAGRQFPGQVALGMLYDPASAARATAAGVGAHVDLTLGRSVSTHTGPSDPPLHGRFKVRAVSDGRCLLKGPMMGGLTVQLGLSACVEIDGVLVAVAGGKKQMLDRELFRMVGVQPEAMRVIVVKSSVHFRADFEPHASHVLVAQAAGPMAADPGELNWQHLSTHTRTRP
ncbi:MAG: M81 family metallopeptidase [Alphaproteobacteria bacterium]|nr:M81 family metallopeptidase [Alphaproteobacteria bacterium]MDI9329947.1 M81 family metallopeptidase [Alphaproteobacteria bacterium]